MIFPKALLAACVTILATIPNQNAAKRSPAVVLSQIQIEYPPIALSALVGGRVSVRVDVRPDGTVANIALVQGIPLLSDPAMNAASRATFDCHNCSDSQTPHVITFVFSWDGADSVGHLRPTTWK